MDNSPITNEMHRRVEIQKRVYRNRRINLEEAFPSLLFEVVDTVKGKDVWMCSRKSDNTPVGLIAWNREWGQYGFAPTNTQLCYHTAFLVDIKRFLQYAYEVSK